MAESDWLESGPLQPLVHELVTDITNRYRIEWSDAESIVCELLSVNQPLRAAAAGTDSPDRLKRTRVFKQAASEVKRKIYYKLRTYRAADSVAADLIERLKLVAPTAPTRERDVITERILETHVSTRERLPQRDDFYRKLFSLVRPPDSVIDVGCGIHPLMFPIDHEWARGLTRFVAVDNNTRDIESLQELADMGALDRRICAFRWDIGEGWPQALQRASCSNFDLALMMKLVPVVQRTNRQQLSILCQTPARQWLVTGSCRSMTKNVSIRRREERVIEAFVRMAGRTIQGEFTVGEEFAWLVE